MKNSIKKLQLNKLNTKQMNVVKGGTSARTRIRKGMQDLKT